MLLPPGASQNIDIRVTSPSPATCGNTSDAVLLYTANSATFLDNFYSTAIDQITAVVGAQGYTFQGAAARVFNTQETSTIPLFHLFQNVVIDSFYTTSATERTLALQSGYIVGGTDTFIYPSQICGSIPFYRLYNSGATEHFMTTSDAVRASMLASGAWADQGIVGYVLDANVCA
ncbi:hypothetical protein MVEN_00742600 [Mycena venus]|uniref:DUF5648 domain-containing protein n=1 Tax=Mycena venus TaxID=2733690 RepID=A0A8H6YKA3_9AGAR|nr:hypothetical protein MVEN_00742600 [Mycena venus]